MIRFWGYTGVLMAGGPYATNDYESILQDSNLDLVVIGEGERTFVHLIREIIKNSGQLPEESTLKKIPGIAYIPGMAKHTRPFAGNREIIFLDRNFAKGRRHLDAQPGEFPMQYTSSQTLRERTAYIIYTSGNTGRTKGVMVEHRNLVSLLFADGFQFDFNHRDNWIMFHSPCFDFSVWEMYGVLLYGGKLKDWASKYPGTKLILESRENCVSGEKASLGDI